MALKRALPTSCGRDGLALYEGPLALRASTTAGTAAKVVRAAACVVERELRDVVEDAPEDLVAGELVQWSVEAVSKRWVLSRPLTSLVFVGGFPVMSGEGRGGGRKDSWRPVYQTHADDEFHQVPVVQTPRSPARWIRLLSRGCRR